MRGHRRTGRNSDFEHAYECVFKNYFVAAGRSLNSIEAVGEIRFVLPIGVKMSRKEKKATNTQGGAQRSPSGIEEAFLICHSANAPVILRKSCC
jgi:hypothetical protein